jgi:hypothetical protein
MLLICKVAHAVEDYIESVSSGTEEGSSYCKPIATTLKIVKFAWEGNKLQILEIKGEIDCARTHYDQP